MARPRRSEQIRRRPSRAAVLAAEREKTEELLARVGYYDLRAKHGRPEGTDFPDLSVEENYPLGNGMSGSTAAKQQPPGVRRFPVGHSHKQGLELLTPGSDPKDYGGNKT